MIDPIVLQISAGDLIPQLTEGQSILWVGTFLALTLIALKLKSPISLFVWALTGVVMILSLVGVVGAPAYWATLALAMIGVVASALYTVSGAR